MKSKQGIKKEHDVEDMDEKEIEPVLEEEQRKMYEILPVDLEKLKGKIEHEQ